jgi:predicted amidohydrolase YtcJ
MVNKSIIAPVKTVLVLVIAVAIVACSAVPPAPADLILVGGKVYTLAWPDPDVEGKPAREAPHGTQGWRPDAEAVAIIGDRIDFAGSRADVEKRRGAATRVIDLQGATVLPGLIDSHVHLANLGASLDRVNLVGVETEADAVERVVARAKETPKGQWIVGWGWDEGAWTSHLPTMTLLSERVPDHPVILHGLHTFAVWGNRLAFERAGITKTTQAPAGGEIRKDATGHPTGVLLNNANALLIKAVPPPSPAQLQERILKALDAMVAAGYTFVHEAGADATEMTAFEALDAAGRLPIPIFVMVAARDTALTDKWLARGPTRGSGKLMVRGVKAFYDGAMGSRGAFFLQPYSDRPDHVGVGGEAYGFDRTRMAAMMKARFQPTIHAIGDRANREALDFFESVQKEAPAARETRPRIEHAQVVSTQDLPRFKELGVIASMQPSHAVEDMAWAETRIGPDRIKGAYAWRSLRRAGARLVFNSDLPATDYNIFYGLHSAVTRTDKEGKPAGGWRVQEAMTIEEALRGWTTWAAYAGFSENDLGVIAAGRPADLTVMSLDPFQIGEKDPARLLEGKIVMTITGGKVTGSR